METLDQTIERLIQEHGAEAFIHAVRSHSASEFKAKTAASDPPPPCPKGYVRVGGVCKLDIGN